MGLRTRNRLVRGFTLIELIIVVVILGVLAAIAVPRFINLGDEAHDSVIKATAGTMQSSVVILRGKTAMAENTGGCRGSEDSFAYMGGDVCLQGGRYGAPFATTGISGSATYSRMLWDILVSSPQIQTGDTESSDGWFDSYSGDCQDENGETSFVYCWGYYVSGQMRAQLVYSARDGAGTVHINWQD